MVSARKLFSVLFLILMALSSIGYYPFLSFIKQQASVRTKHRIDSHAYDLGASLIIKVPFSYPYSSHSHHYQPASGEITYRDTVYQLVRQRVYLDTLYLVCIRDSRTTEAQSRVADYAMSLSNENKHQTQGASPVDVFTKYYCSKVVTFCLTDCCNTSNITFGDAPPGLYYYTPVSDVFHPPGLTA